jgi:hypothetical protein
MINSKRSLFHPVWLMIYFWLFLYAMHSMAPYKPYPSITIFGTMFLVSHVCIFCLAAFCGARGLRNNISQEVKQNSFSPNNSAEYSGINLFFLISISGIIMGLFDKSSKLISISLSSIAESRSNQAQIVLDAVQSESSSILGLVSLISYPAYFVALVVTIVLYEYIPGKTRFLYFTNTLLIFLLSMASGGRSIIFVTIIFTVLALLVRKTRCNSMIPKSTGLRFIVLVTIISFIVYSSFVWKARAEVGGMHPNHFLTHIEQNWGITPSEKLVSLSNTIDNPEVIQNFVSSLFYLTQSIAITERIIAIDQTPILLGAHHIDVVAAGFRLFSDDFSFLKLGNAILLQENVYGFFTGAWGALYIDYGFWGSYLATILWGLCAGTSHRHTRRQPYSNGYILYLFWMYSILISFISPPFGFSNSAVTFVWFVLFLLFNKSRKVLLNTKT